MLHECLRCFAVIIAGKQPNKKLKRYRAPGHRGSDNEILIRDGITVFFIIFLLYLTQILLIQLFIRPLFSVSVFLYYVIFCKAILLFLLHYL